VSISQVLTILFRRSWIVLLTLAAALIAASAVLIFVPGRYDAFATATVDSAVDPVSGMGPGASMMVMVQGNLLQLVQSQRVALDVVKRLNLTANPATQEQYRQSPSFGRESIEEWMAGTILNGVDPKFELGSNVLSIRYKSGNPNQAALLANAFLASTIDASIEMKASSAEQTAGWFAPQIQELRAELEQARKVLEQEQIDTNVTSLDTDASALSAVSNDLAGAKAALTALQSRLDSGSTNLSVDPSDPDLQTLSSLKDKLTTSQVSYDAIKATLGSNNPKMLTEAANIVQLKKQIAASTDKMLEHLKDRIAQTQGQIQALETRQASAQKAAITAQARRDRVGMLQRDVAFRLEQLNEREKAAAQAKLQSKLTFANIAVLDKALPPLSPAFPKFTLVIIVAIGGGLALGLVLALLAEMLDRRVRAPLDLEFASSGPLLGVIRGPRKIGGFRRPVQRLPAT
jgi:polysaccharide biosynthesis transport protein